MDIETSGLYPGKGSLLSIGAVAYDDAGNELGSYQVNLDRMLSTTVRDGLFVEIPDDPETMRLWAKQPLEAWDAARVGAIDPSDAMFDFVSFCNSYPKPMLVCEPTGFDFSWIYYYLGHYNIKHKLQHSAMDIKTMAAVALGCDYFDAIKRNFPEHWLPKGTPHTHVAVEDAREQGELFFKIKQELDAALIAARGEGHTVGGIGYYESFYDTHKR